MTDEQIVQKALAETQAQFGGPDQIVTMSETPTKAILMDVSCKSEMVTKIDNIVSRLSDLRYELVFGGCADSEDIDWLIELDE